MLTKFCIGCFYVFLSDVVSAAARRKAVDLLCPFPVHSVHQHSSLVQCLSICMYTPGCLSLNFITYQAIQDNNAADTSIGPSTDQDTGASTDQDTGASIGASTGPSPQPVTDLHGKSQVRIAGICVIIAPSAAEQSPEVPYTGVKGWQFVSVN